MDVQRQTGMPGIRCQSVLWTGIVALISSLTLSPVVAPCQSAAPAVENVANGPANTDVAEVRQTALRHLRDGNLDQALKVLETVAENTLSIPLDRIDPLASVHAGLNRALSQLDPEAQYELLSKWTLPNTSPKRIRHLAGLTPTTAPPAEFARALGERPRATSFPISSIGPVRGIFSTHWSLLGAAQKSGRLKRLTTDLISLVDQKVSGADRLLALARIADDRGDVSSVAGQLSDRIARMKSEPGRATIDLNDVILAVSALNHRDLCPQSEELLGTLIAGTHGSPALAIRPFLRQAQAIACLLSSGDTTPSEVTSLLATRLKYWVPLVRDTGRSNSQGLNEAAWLVQEDQILHWSGSPNDTLLLRYPMTGDFQFHCEAQLDGLSATNGTLRYGGLLFQTEGSSGPLLVRDVDGNTVQTRTSTVAHPGAIPQFNRMTVASTPNSAAMLLNLHQVWSESKGVSSSPWVGLASRGDARPLFRNLRVTGQAVIPRSVRLSEGDQLRSWQPQWWADQTVDAKVASGWTVSHGVIQSQRHLTAEQKSAGAKKGDSAQSCLSYDRPLLTGETIEYEFFYEAGTTEVHPAFGRVAFLLQPEGVRIHWITDRYDWTSLSTENSVVEPLNRRGPRPLPFKARDWNRLSINRTDQAVTLSLNEVVIYERPVDWIGDHRFGLYRDSSTSEVKVRNVDLTGDWPETLPADFLENPATTVGEPLTASQRHCLNRLFQEEFLTDNVSAIRHKAGTMSVADRFEFLSRWILPGPDHPGFRVTGDITQTLPPNVTHEPGMDRPEVGGQIVSPVFDWLDAAKELGRLPECLTKVDGAVVPDSEPQRRARAGLSLLLNLELGNQQSASERLETLYDLIRPSTAEEQWSEILIVDRCVRRFATNEIVAKLLADIRTLRAPQTRSMKNALWQAHLGALLTQSQTTKPDAVETTDEAPSFNDWIPVTAATAATRGQGYPMARWHRSDHKILKRASHEDDYLFYRSPLGGDYEVECDLIDTTQVMTIGSYIGARSDRKNLDIGTFRAVSAGEPVEPQFSPFWPSVRYRGVIRYGSRSISLNGRPVKSEKLTGNSDPWLAIRSAGRSVGGIQDLRMSGRPRVLDAVPLSDSPQLSGWISYHGEPVLHETSGWTHAADSESSGWIVGHPNPAAAGMSIEGLLRYQRPLIEDGAIEYEFFYDPVAFEVHPALDRLALILHPAGVREHWIGDGRYDRTDLLPDNQSDVPACRRGPAELPLMSGEWNQLRLLIEGALVKVELNGQLIYERKLESTNQRTFGLFHFQGNTSVRVRNAVMRGDWPKQVPSVTSQELADDTIDRLEADLAGLRAEFVHDFQKDGAPDQYFKSPTPNTTLRVIHNPQGVQASQRAVGPHTGFNIIPRFSLCGDFDIEARFTDLRIEGSGDAGIMLNATLEEPLRHEYRALRMKTTPGNQDLHSSVSVVRPDGGRTYVGDSRSFEALRGRIRLARRGQRVYYLFAENDSDHFFLFGSEPSSNNDTAIDGIFLHSFCNGVSISQVNWTKLILRADRIKWYSLQPPPPQDSLWVMSPDGKRIQILASPGSVRFATVAAPDWSPDHGRIAMEMSNGAPATAHIFVVDTDGKNLKDLGVGCIPSFSGDGNRLVCSVVGKGVVVMRSNGTEREVLCATGWGAQWSPDGTTIAFAEGDNITLLDVNSRKSSPLLKGDAATRYRSIANLGWSHDSRSITFKGLRQDVVREELSLMPLDSPGELKILHPNAHAVTSDITYSPDNQQVIVGIKGVANHQTKLYSLDRKRPGPAAPIFSSLLSDHKISGYAWSHDGKSIAITSHSSAPYVDWSNGPTSKRESH